MKKKHFITILLVFSIFFGGNTTLSAETPGDLPIPPGIGLFWKELDSVSIYLNFNNGKALIDAYITGNPGTIEIVATLKLIRSGFAHGIADETVKTWSKMVYDDELTFVVNHPVTSGYAYTAELSIIVYRGTKVEKTTSRSTKYAP